METDDNTITRASGPRFLLEETRDRDHSILFPVIIGVVGAAILCALGVWQMQRLAWKEGIIAQIDERLQMEPISLPENPSFEVDNYRRVELGGEFTGDELHVLTSNPPFGPGFRIIGKFETLGGREIMIDMGFVPEAEKNRRRESGAVFIEGSLVWPDEIDVFTPRPDLQDNIWFARHVERMANALEAEPVMVAASSFVPPVQTTPIPVTINIRNNHLEYAITWFSLMVVWIMMTLYLIWRIKRGIA